MVTFTLWLDDELQHGIEEYQVRMAKIYGHSPTRIEIIRRALDEYLDI